MLLHSINFDDREARGRLWNEKYKLGELCRQVGGNHNKKAGLAKGTLTMIQILFRPLQFVHICTRASAQCSGNNCFLTWMPSNHICILFYHGRPAVLPPTPLILLKAIHNKREILGSGVQTFSSPPYHKGPTCPGNIPQITKKADKSVLITSLEQCCLTAQDVKLNTILIWRKWCQGLIFPLQVKQLINMRAGL